MDNPFNDVLWSIDAEGMHYCFDGYSNWIEIKDEQFHKLRQAYLSAAEDLEMYVYDNADKEE